MKTTTLTLLALAASAIAAPLARRYEYSPSSAPSHPQHWEEMETFPSSGNPNHPSKRAHHEEIEQFPASGRPEKRNHHEEIEEFPASGRPEKRHQYQQAQPQNWHQQEEIEKFPSGDGKPNTADDRKVKRNTGHTETFGEAESRAGRSQKRQACLLLCDDNGRPLEFHRPATSLDAPVHRPEQVARPASNPAASESEQDFRTAVEPQEGDPVGTNTFEEQQ
ncbi:hypothetical protein FPQ18DRAFT_82942 [Pyronema domesticum]|uniref:Uncharacterized protein n=1 Tax=Pyronema omphalodes (strain CBS 100304) TaxID=1076935 RepID=U4LE90_PYROM|nr:hypothetical protein FPQ18DRAFT_82942 [Pyronema domesticum]CCX09538.1 Protein of unknown function [Pyronema omphalodes CBS 100304]